MDQCAPVSHEQSLNGIPRLAVLDNEVRQNLRSSLLGADSFGRYRFTGDFPGALRTIHRRFIAILNAIVLVGFAHRSQRLVVKTRQSKTNFQLFRERLQGFEVFGGRRHFGFRGLQKLLVAPVDEFRNLAADEISGIGDVYKRQIPGRSDSRATEIGAPPSLCSTRRLRSCTSIAFLIT